VAGIAGTLDRASAEPVVRTMLAALAHRGPDAADVLADGAATLGAGALGVVDGDTALAADDELVVALDGDLLRPAQAAAFHAAWRAHGSACLDALDGTFAAAVWERRAERLTLVRDRLGTRPLYLTTDGCVRFASELPALLAADDAPRAVDDDRVLAYLARGVADVGTATMVRGIERVPSGGLVEIDRDGRRCTWLWHRFGPVPLDGDVAQTLRRLLRAATAQRLPPRGVVGATLSGGLDSAAVLATAAALCRESGADVPAAVVLRTRDPRTDEWPYARAVLDAVGADAVVVTIEDGDLVRDADRFLLALGEPCHDFSVYGHWRAMQAARAAGLDVVLEGQTGERFGGVGAWYPQVMFDLLARGRPAAALGQARARRRVEGVPVATTLLDLAKLLAPARLRAGRGRPAWLAPDAHVDLPRVPRRYLALQLHEVGVDDFPQQARETDRDASSFGLVERAPFQDARVIGYGLSLAPEVLYRDGWGKWPIRAAMRGLVPDVVLDRPTKQGFTVDAPSWVGGAFGELAERTLRSDAAASRPYWSPVRIAGLAAEVRAGRAPAAELWRAFSVERWLELLVDRP
jgi:asparagine synthase (glutamine-hydrolysing)